MKKLVAIERLGGKPRKKADSVEETQERNYGASQDGMLLSYCEGLWNNLAETRRRRERCIRFMFGDQWSDLIKYEGKDITEREYLIKKGNVPLTNNLMMKNFNTVIGLFTKNETEPVCSARDRDEQKVSEMMTITVQANWQKTNMREMSTHFFSELYASGICCARETYEWRDVDEDSFTDFVPTNGLFFDGNLDDPRMRDMRTIGAFWDIPFTEVIAKFGNANDPGSIEKLKSLYARGDINSYTDMGMDVNEKGRYSNLNFRTPVDPNLCRVYEVWTKEIKLRYHCHDWLNGSVFVVNEEDYDALVQDVNNQRMIDGIEQGLDPESIPLIETQKDASGKDCGNYDEYWYCRFMNHNGTILWEGESPFEHKGHPFTIATYPILDGKVMGFGYFHIDQQKFINRLVTMNDFLIRNSAKGALLVHKKALGSNSPEQLKKSWVDMDGVIVWEGDASVPKPEQLSTNVTNIGTDRLLEIEKEMMEDVSGVSGAIQGKTPYSGTSAALYNQQTSNSTNTVSGLFQVFSKFIRDVSVKKLKNIQQFYDRTRKINIAGKSYSDVNYYDPAEVGDLEFNVSVEDAAGSPVHRMVNNDLLMQLLEQGQIDVEMLLENGDFPFADQLLQSIQRKKQEMAEQQMQGGTQQGGTQQGGSVPPQN